MPQTDIENHSLNLIAILEKGYRQDKNGRWVHKGKYGLPKEIIQYELKAYCDKI